MKIYLLAVLETRNLRAKLQVSVKAIFSASRPPSYYVLSWPLLGACAQGESSAVSSSSFKRPHTYCLIEP